MDALTIHRLHFAFTITFHYLFPQLTMGLALLILILKTMALRTGNEHYNRAARFWAKIFAINFAMGVVTGIPMEFQFGTNWARFSKAAGGVIGQTLAMEGVFSFFLESSFLGVFLFGEKRLGPKAHWFAAFLVFAGSWLSGFFIIATDAWMQHPTGYRLGGNGEILLTSFWGLLGNPWLFWQYLHNMTGSVVTGSFVMASVGAFYLLTRRNEDFGRTFVRLGVIAGTVSTILMAFPTGDGQGKNIAFHQPPTLAAMEGLFETEAGAPLALIGQPDIERRRLDNPLTVPRALSFLTYQRWGAEVKGLDGVPAGPLAGQYSAAVLQLSHHGGAGNRFHRGDGAGIVLPVAGHALPRGAAAVGVDAAAAVSIHRHDGGLGHGGSGAPAVADLRHHAHAGRRIAPRVSRQRAFHAARLHGNLYDSGDTLPVPGLSRNRARAGA